MMEVTEAKFMNLAFEKALAGIRVGQSPFGACVVQNEQVISCAHNTVWESMDVTAHAEMNAIREACRALGVVDLSGCVIYCTSQPCPMCFAACQKAGIERLVYSTRAEDTRRVGFGARATAEERVKTCLPDACIEVVPDFLREQGLGVLEVWRTEGDGRIY